MDALTSFGLIAVTAMLVAYALEERSPHYILAFAIACGLGSIYGFLQGHGRSDSSRRCGPGSPCDAGCELRKNAWAETIEAAPRAFASGGFLPLAWLRSRQHPLRQRAWW